MATPAAGKQLIVLITGCSSGIGLSIAALLARDPARRFRVYATMRRADSEVRERLMEAVDRPHGATAGTSDQAAKTETLFVKELDVSKSGNQQSVVDWIVERESRIDVLVNNAGVLEWDAVDTLPMDKALAMFDVNFWGVVRMVQAVLPIMKKQRSGRIINISSIFGLQGSPFQTFYSASKFAVEGLTESMQPLLSLYNIRSILIEPGLVYSKMTKMVADHPNEFVVSIPQTAGFDATSTAAFVETLASKQTRELLAAMQQPDQAAETVREAILSEAPKLRYQTSDFAEGTAAKYNKK